jgi:hypothetical protein
VPPLRAAFTGILALLLAAPLAGCRKRPPPAAPARTAAAPLDAGSVRCPTPEALAALVVEPGRTVRVDCFPYSPQYFWTAAALSYDPKGGGPPPRLAFVTGGPGLATLAFDIDPGPTEAIDRLIRGSRGVAVRIKPARSRQHLVRLGVVGQHDPRGSDGLQSEELALVLQLVAHAAPKLIWTGPGDQTVVGPDGCVSERTIDFEMPFRRDLEVFTSSQSRATGGKPCPPGGPGTQESIPARAISLKAARPLAAATPR